MSRYIDADKLLTDELTHVLPFGCGRSGGRVVIFMADIEKQPTADVAPVRHGHWIIRDVKGLEKEVSCSVCHSKDYYSPEWYKFIRYPAYCSDCGAKMDEERKNENGT